MSNVPRVRLFKSNGFPIQGLRNCLEVFDCKTLEELQTRVADGIVSEHEILWVRGNGTKAYPGLLACYLFPHLKTSSEQRQERIMNNLGAGI